MSWQTRQSSSGFVPIVIRNAAGTNHARTQQRSVRSRPVGCLQLNAFWTQLFVAAFSRTSQSNACKKRDAHVTSTHKLAAHTHIHAHTPGTYLVCGCWAFNGTFCRWKFIDYVVTLMPLPLGKFDLWRRRSPVEPFERFFFLRRTLRSS